MKNILRKIVKKFLLFSLPELASVINNKIELDFSTRSITNSRISDKSKIYGSHIITNTDLGDYSYISFNSRVNLAKIGKFCSIGPNFICGCGIHPTHGISTSPMFYANNLSNGITLSKTTKIEQNKQITIGNDVWIGINVTILDGVTIGDGAIIAAGSVVNKDVPDYAIYGGVPAKLIRYRLKQDQIEELKKIKWWDFDFNKLKEIEENFFEVDKFIKNIK